MAAPLTSSTGNMSSRGHQDKRCGAASSKEPAAWTPADGSSQSQAPSMHSEYAGTRMLAGDLKPGNVLLKSAGQGRLVAKLADFGLRWAAAVGSSQADL